MTRTNVTIVRGPAGLGRDVGGSHLGSLSIPSYRQYLHKGPLLWSVALSSARLESIQMHSPTPPRRCPAERKGRPVQGMVSTKTCWYHYCSGLGAPGVELHHCRDPEGSHLRRVDVWSRVLSHHPSLCKHYLPGRRI